MESVDAAVEEARAAELRRCHALEAGDMETLAALLHPDLVYVHSNGAIDDRASYLARSSQAGVRFLRSERRGLHAWRAGDTVLMSGEIVTVMERPPGGERTETIAFLTQTYVHDDAGWRMAQLHATKGARDERGH
jgi:hypothetical protein